MIKSSNTANGTPPVLVPLSTLEDLKRVLFVQKTIAQECRRELIATATAKEIATGEVSAPEEMRRIIKAQTALLEKYAKYPTLSEFMFHPDLAGSTRWGATFGVTILVRALILDPIKAAMQAFAPFMRSIYLLLIKELDNPTHEYLIEPLEENIKFRVTMGENGEEITDERSTLLTRKLLYQVTESLLMISAQYGIIGATPGGFQITDMGRRVLLHLVDSSVFLEELVEAHKRFQSEKPKLNFI
jgi:hypothetical protein